MLSEKFEELILLLGKRDISDVDNESPWLLDESDSEALADLQGFGAQLQCHMKISCVLGGKAQLVKWIIAIMRRYSVENENSRNLLEDESLVIFHIVTALKKLYKLLI